MKFRKGECESLQPEGEIRCLNAKFKNLTRQQFNKKSVGVM